MDNLFHSSINSAMSTYEGAQPWMGLASVEFIPPRTASACIHFFIFYDALFFDI